MLGWVLGKVAYLLSAFRLPVYQGTIKLAASNYTKHLVDDVTIIRDSFGVPHIYAKNLSDCVFGQGFAMAQERLWQMESLRRFALGTLSEMLPDLLPVDILSRTLGFARLAQHDVESATEEQRKQVESFCNGINAYLTSTEVYSKPIELTFLGLEPKIWEPIHVAAISRVFCFQMSRGWLNKIINLAVADTIGTELLADFQHVDDDSSVPLTAPKGDIEVNQINWEKIAEQANLLPPTDQGSNSWVISGKYTEDGKPILASDPHLNVSCPSIWFQCHLHCDVVSAAGVAMCATPFIGIGHNEHMAFGVTLAYTDVCDVYIEEFQKQDSTLYKYKDQWVKCDIVEEMFHVKGNVMPVVEKIRTTIHGPVISGAIKPFAAGNDLKQDSEQVTKEFAIMATFLQQSNTGLPICGFGRVMTSKNWDEFKTACEDIDKLSLNITYADIYGNIGYYMTGNVPIRTKKAMEQVNYPISGVNGDCEWQGYIPKSDRPHCLNPEQGYIISCNHRIVGDDYKYFLGNSFKHARRAMRADELIKKKLKENGKLTVKDSKDMQLDITDCHPEFVSKFIDVLNGVDLVQLLKEQKIQNPDQLSVAFVEQAMKEIRAWNGVCAMNSVGATLHTMFQCNLLKRILEGTLKNSKLVEMVMGCGLNQTLFVVSEYHSHETQLLHNLMKRQDSSSLLAKAGGAQFVVLQAILDAIHQARALIPSITKHPQDPAKEYEQYLYGHVHTLSFNHAMGVKIADFNRGPYPIGGGPHTLNLQAFYPDAKQYASRVYPSFRMVVPMSNVAAAEGILAPGNSGHLYSSHYDDWIEPFLHGKYLPMLFKKEDVEKFQEKLVLTTK
jgi:penicillin amidase